MGKPTNAPSDYDRGVLKTVPLYEEFHRHILDLVAHSGVTPERWLDAGTGTGKFAAEITEAFPGVQLSLFDPDPDFLAVARERLAGNGAIADIRQTTSEDADYPDDYFDIATAVLSHHYLQPEGRKRAVQNIARMLKPGGLFVTTEHVAPFTSRGLDIALARWRDFQVASGKPADKAASHVARYGEEFLPITAQDHLTLLRDCGFGVAEIFWYAYGQVGVYGIKG
ncbi:MAG: class I SAM-dependent methyltransferase [Planctomycetaceae bacterium]|nr:class I SAM-dependent methyltransferase [Planctomycetaceae bacterium]